MLHGRELDEFRSALIAGHYNLLLGSGVVLDSRNKHGATLRSARKLAEDIARMVGAPPDTRLTRSVPLLSPMQVQAQLVEPYSGCQPGPTLAQLPSYLWRRLFTFNIDDTIEALYEGHDSPKQTLRAKNFDSALEPTPSREELLAIHLHGCTRWPAHGFVFSVHEYAKSAQHNPWMSLLAQILATESFIISGASLDDEFDLEFYLANRSPETPRRGRGPSLLVIPNAGVIAESDCRKHGLRLVPATFGEFMDWVRTIVPAPPTFADLVVPDIKGLFSQQPSPATLLRFFSDFELVLAVDRPLPAHPGPFLYGREPSWIDLDAHLDVERADNSRLMGLVEERATNEKGKQSPRVIVLMGEAGAGKTTAVKRVAHDLSARGRTIFAVKTLGRIDAIAAAECLGALAGNCVLIIDGIADHAEQLLDILERIEDPQKVSVLGAERSYRAGHVDVVLRDVRPARLELRPMVVGECLELLGRYKGYGLVADAGAISQPTTFATAIAGEPTAVAVCRILNDFRPLDAIAESLWQAGDPKARLVYLAAALAQHCYGAGVRYSVLQDILGKDRGLGGMIDAEVPLRLSLNPREDEFVHPANTSIGERMLFGAVEGSPEVMFSAFRALASRLAPHVNRRAIKRRSPEARLAGRLFDADKVVKPLLRARAEEFYIKSQDEWRENSRYWEQRALLIAEQDLRTALQYARHALAVERHAFGLTTLGKLLLKNMVQSPEERNTSYAEALEALGAAISFERSWHRRTVHPFALMLSGTAKFLEIGGQLSAAQRAVVDEAAGEAAWRFEGDVDVEAALDRLDALLG